MVVSTDGSLIAQAEPTRIALIDGATLGVIGEIGVDPEAEGCDLALCGDPLRLVVLSRYPSSARLHVIDPQGPTAVGELTLRAAMRLVASSGDYVWLMGAGGATVVDVVTRELVPSPLALRGPVAAVGRFSTNRFVVSTAGMLEEWDPENRAPARRFRLGKPTAARFVGGGARQVWMVPADGDRLELIPLISHGQPPRIELPEPPLRIATDNSHEALVVVGARTGAVYVVDLTGRTPLATLEGVTGSDAVWFGPNPSVVVLSARGLELVPTGRPRPGFAAGGGERTQVLGAQPATTASASAPVAAIQPATSAAFATRPTSSLPAGPRLLTGAAATPAATTDSGITERLVAWRERMRAVTPRAASSPGWVTDPASSSWRDELASWARSVLSGTRGELPQLHDGPPVIVAERLAMTGELAQVLWLLYGAHLCGLDGVAAIDLTLVIGRRWDEALGQGRLAMSGALRWRRSRIRLRSEVLAALDEAPPRGVLIDSPAVLPETAVAVIATASADLIALATWIAPQLGPVLVASPRRPTRLTRHLVEARVRGALPVLRWPTLEREPGTPPPVALLVVPDEAAARAAQAPVLATWPPP